MGFWMRLRLWRKTFWAWLTGRDLVWFKFREEDIIYLLLVHEEWDPFQDPNQECKRYVKYRYDRRKYKTYLLNSGRTVGGDRWKFVNKERQAAHELAWGELASSGRFSR